MMVKMQRIDTYLSMEETDDEKDIERKIKKLNCLTRTYLALYVLACFVESQDLILIEFFDKEH